jgi:hypothetical protein
VGTLEAHIDALRLFAPDVLELYAAGARRELELAEERGTLAPHELDRLRAVLAKPA